MLRMVVLAAFLFSSLVRADELSLDEVRGRLLNQEVVVLGSSHSSGPVPVMVDWYLVSHDEVEGYRRINLLYANSHAPRTVRGKRGVVVSIEEAKNFSRAKMVGERDVFGSSVSVSDAKNPYVSVVVKLLEDDLLVGVTDYYGSMVRKNIRMVYEAEVRKKEIERTLSQLVGKELYKTGYTKLFDSVLSLKILSDHSERGFYQDRGINNLTPLIIRDTKYLEAEDAVVLKVELPDGGVRLLFEDLYGYDSDNRRKVTQSQRINISAAERIPSKFSKKELAAIKDGAIFRGMSEDALYWSLGYSERVNDWGNGGKQHIYRGGFYVYVIGMKVRDWQSFR